MCEMQSLRDRAKRGWRWAWKLWDQPLSVNQQGFLPVVSELPLRVKQVNNCHVADLNCFFCVWAKGFIGRQPSLGVAPAVLQAGCGTRTGSIPLQVCTYASGSSPWEGLPEHAKPCLSRPMQQCGCLGPHSSEGACTADFSCVVEPLLRIAVIPALE